VSRPANRSDSSGPGRRSARSAAASGGWAALNKAKAAAPAAEGFYKRLELTSQPLVVAFLQPEPFSVYRQHWVAKAEGRKSFTCLGEDCPLCNLPDDVDEKTRKEVSRTTLKALFNVVALPDLDDEDPKLEVRVLECGVTLASQIADYAEQSRTSPIDREDVYWALARKESGSGDRVKYTYKLDPIKARDLEEDWEAGPITGEDRESLAEGLYTEDVVRVDAISELEDLVDELF